ncbi:MAG TPA: flagellar hook-associated protein FlgK [Steroidobacteraceae bacterium]|nr:flagellar hook-associated protein FlgK [Steroidobacteraceae bacterium]
MADVLSTSVSGLLAFQKALSVTSNNVANVNTPGYSVEAAQFTPQPGETTGIGYFGTGVTISSVTRSYSELLAGQMRTSQSSYSSFNSFATAAASVDNILSDTTTGLNAQLQNFSNSLQTLANSPTLAASGTAVLSSAQSLAQSIQGYASQINATEQNVEGQISSNVQEINSLAGSIATVNGQISQIQNSGQSPNSLLDQRDQLINQLSQYVSVNTATQSDGTLNVFIGNGQALVSGGNAESLTATPNQYNPTQFDVSLLTAGSATPIDITGSISGGSLGGLLSVRSQVIEPTLNALGQIAVGIATVVNQQQAAGLTQSGTQGQPLFSVGGVQVSNSANNTGTAQVSATSTSLSALTTDNYTLTDNGGTWQLYDETSQQALTMGGDGSAGNPFTAAGLSIVVNGAANSGDSYLIEPTANAAAGFGVLLTSPTQIASAAAVQSGAASANTGTGTIAAATVTDPTNANLLTPTSIVFTSPGQYTLNGTTYAYTPGAAISANGWTTTISGTPAAGDTFTVSSNAGNVGDNTNLFAMIDGLKANVLNGGSASLTGATSSLVSQVGAQTQQAQANSQAQQAVNTSATDAVNNLSGVNLDEEAANMVKYQQAYQACAQMIQASTTMFNTLITAISTA